MALAVLNIPFNLISGKMANPVNNSGVVAMPTEGRNVLRQMVIPDNPDTPRQQATRAIFTSNAVAFSALSGANYNSWNVLATNFVRNGRLDLGYTLSGIAIYNSVNYYRQANAQAAVATAPTYSSTGTPILGPVLVDEDDLVMLVDTTGLPAGDLLLIRFSLPLAGNRRGQRNDVRIQTAATASSFFVSTANAAQSLSFTGLADSLNISAGDRVAVLGQPLTTTYLPGVAAFNPSIVVANL